MLSKKRTLHRRAGSNCDNNSNVLDRKSEMKEDKKKLVKHDRSDDTDDDDDDYEYEEDEAGLYEGTMDSLRRIPGKNDENIGIRKANWKEAVHTRRCNGKDLPSPSLVQACRPESSARAPSKEGHSEVDSSDTEKEQREGNEECGRGNDEVAMGNQHFSSSGESRDQQTNCEAQPA